MAKSKTSIVYGANTVDGGQYVGKTVSEIKKALAQSMNIPQNAQARIGGSTVKSNTKLAEGQKLEFVKASGGKGAA